jgi:isopentenyl phosphate kinase
MKIAKNSPEEHNLVFLKLGGSLITDKLIPRTPRLDVLDRVAGEIQASLVANPGLKILLGHGSGSFGHTSGSQYRTRDGVSTPEEWLGFSEVWQDATDLNNLVMASLREAGLPAIAFPPSASILTQNKKIVTWDLSQIQITLEKNLLPVVYGDVVFDDKQGGTILSTEELFIHLAATLRPRRILLAGQDPGVWQDFPACKRLYENLKPADLVGLRDKIERSAAPDVTGGMGEKVDLMLDLISTTPDLEALIFSGNEPGQIQRALAGESPGTRLHN